GHADRETRAERGLPRDIRQLRHPRLYDRALSAFVARASARAPRPGPRTPGVATYTGAMETLQGKTASAPEWLQVESQGVLLAFTNPPTGEEEAFNAAYQEHAAARLRVPGILNARRYMAVADEGPRYMAFYDLEAPAAVQRPEYARLASEASPSERDMFARLPLLDRRVLKLVLGTAAWTEDPPYIMTVALEPAAGTRDDFIAWYHQEHNPLLLPGPGGAAPRPVRHVRGKGAGFWALPGCAPPTVVGPPECREASGDPLARARDGWCDAARAPHLQAAIDVPAAAQLIFSPVFKFPRRMRRQ